ncbi:adenylate/guanylate cyclase domain-containing protein [Aeromicrobium terrae]|uniref:HAMP domain-containing protein n=1 Tax=Aeromicrobium terrae TaxID=2498846 RepID=A0A5C8NHM3_9ACTN|nr:adenylate/guanylate cyclase domain-containing protein [Aeromicrobium terrae]TXL60680.1 HAMP domain-containing protein [Aeromicrobium terrae]
MMHKHVEGVRPWHVLLDTWVANVVGATILLVEYLFVVPLPPEATTSDVTRDNLVLAAFCTLASWSILAVFGGPRTSDALGWTVRGTAPTKREAELTIGLPWYLFLLQAITWTLSSIPFLVLNLPTNVPFGFVSSGMVLFGGLATATTSFMLLTRLLRPATVAALVVHPPAPGTAAGVGERAIFTWTLTTGVPVLGFVLLVAFAPFAEASIDRIAVSGLIIGLVILGVGLLSTILLAKSIGEPLCDMTTALAQVESGDLDVEVSVDDNGEIGQMQAGLNRMVAAMREREQLRDLFGRHVGEDVARQALEHGVELGGQELEAAALFVDVIGSTTLAATRPPAEVVTALNRFFSVVVDVVGEHGGLVNKFEGDAALCIFGAPLALDDAAASALSAARVMAERLREEVPELDAGIGVSQGIVIAGNIGATHRLEYTVIGDPVNEAARLTEQAKNHDGRVVASQRIVDNAHPRERERWTLLEPLLLRGRAEPTMLAVPA